MGNPAIMPSKQICNHTSYVASLDRCPSSPSISELALSELLSLMLLRRGVFDALMLLMSSSPSSEFNSLKKSRPVLWLPQFPFSVKGMSAVFRFLSVCGTAIACSRARTADEDDDIFALRIGLSLFASTASYAQHGQAHSLTRCPV